MSAVAQPLNAQQSTRHHSKLYWAIADTIVIARRHILHIPQVPEQLFSATIQPIMFVLLFRYVFGGAIDVPGSSYVNYLMAGIFVQSIALEGLTSGISLAQDLKRGIIDRFRTLPMSPSAVLVGPIISDLIRNVVIIGVMLSVGLAIGFRPEASLLDWLAALGLLLGVSAAVSWIGMMVALIVRDPEAVQTVAFIVMMPLTFASGAFVPVETMPGWMQPFVTHQPITVIANAVRSLLLGQPVGSAGWQAAAWCIGLFAVCLPIAVTLFRRIGRD